MENADFEDAPPDPISISHCREMLGDEADTLSDQEVDLTRQHADAMAQVLVEIFLENHTTPE